MSLSMKQKDAAVKLLADTIIKESSENQMVWKLNDFENSFGEEIPGWEKDVLKLASLRGTSPKTINVISKWVASNVSDKRMLG